MIGNTKRKLARLAIVVSVATFLTPPVVKSQAQDGRQVISHPAPVYSDFARKLGVTGAVKVQVVIAPDGKIKETKVIGGHPVLIGAVEEALKNWRYAPGSGETTAVLEFHFHP